MMDISRAMKSVEIQQVRVTRWSSALVHLPHALATAFFHGTRHAEILRGIVTQLKLAVAQVPSVLKMVSYQLQLFADPKMACAMWLKHATAHPVSARMT
jgi:hypothetical protein